MSETNDTGAVTGAPLLLLRIEGLALFAACIGAYAYGSASWWLFAALLLAPDLSMLGFLAGPRAGAVAYNAAHTTTLPIALGSIGYGLGLTWTTPVALIWLAHIGMDRAVGYGLKYAKGFSFTHLGKAGKAAPT